MSTDSSNSPPASGGAPVGICTPKTSSSEGTPIALKKLSLGGDGAENLDDITCSSDTQGAAQSQAQQLSECVGAYRHPNAPQQPTDLFDTGSSQATISTGSPVRGIRPRQLQAGHRGNPDAFNFAFDHGYRQGHRQDHRQMVPRPTRGHTPRYPTRYPREDLDPQSRGPASACVFIGNLPRYKDDAAILDKVQEIFTFFGTVYPKIFRDPNENPYMFAQYTNDEDARRAFNGGQGVNIFGRPCRIEPAKAAKVSYYIARRDGHNMTEAEAIQALLGAEILSIEPLNQQIRQYLNLAGGGYLIKFRHYKAGCELVLRYNSDNIYTVRLFNDEGKSRPHHSFPPPRSGDKDSRTIWIENLHGGIQEAEVHDLAINFGEIKDIFIKDVEFFGSHGPNQRAWAFVEFERPQSVDSAIAGLHNTSNPRRDGLLRVEPKRPRFHHQQKADTGSQRCGTARLLYEGEPETPVRDGHQNQLVTAEVFSGQGLAEQQQAFHGSDPHLTPINAPSGVFHAAPVSGMPSPLVSGPFPTTMFPAPLTPHQGVPMQYMYGYPQYFSNTVCDPFQGWTPPGGFLVGGMPPPGMGQGPGDSVDDSESAKNLEN